MTQTKQQPRKRKQHKTQQNKTSLVQSLLMTLGQETRWAYSTMLPSQHGTVYVQKKPTLSNVRFEI